MDDFTTLLHTLQRLIGPGGCPWDQEQTLQSLRHTLVEETFEVIEAIDLDNNHFIKEELGDLLFNAFFLCIVAEKEGRFTVKEAVQQIISKLIRRHPHVFGDKRLETSDQVLKQWEEIKKEEKKEERKSALDGIPKDLPALAKAHKMAKKLASKSFTPTADMQTFSEEEKAGEMLWQAVKSISQQGIQAEHALRKRLGQIEAEFRDWESKPSH